MGPVGIPEYQRKWIEADFASQVFARLTALYGHKTLTIPLQIVPVVAPRFGENWQTSIAK